MRKIHKATTLATFFCFASAICLILGYFLIPAILSLLAFFLVIRELPIYTSSYQFITLACSALLLGISVDTYFPLITFAMLLLAGTSMLRIAFFRFFSYTSYPWIEPAQLLAALILYLIAVLAYNTSWQAYVFPLPVFIFSGVFTWGTFNDRNQLLKRSRGGYRVQTGKEADDFELPDQSGELVKLSDYRGKRHILLIFVRGDWCPGCHMTLRSYEKNNLKFQEKNILVMAIGPDPIGVNRGMVEKLGLDFKILSDEKQRTAMIYGVQLKEYDNPFAEKYEEGIPLPASFLVDKNGIVRYVSRPDNVGEFLNPSLIFPVVEQLDGLYKKRNSAEAEKEIKNTSVTKEELKNHEQVISDLKKQLSNYESIIDQANDAMVVIDIVDGKIHQCNPSSEKLLGYSKEELERLSLFDLHPREYLDKSSRVVADVWEKGGLIYTDIPFITKSGEQIPVECSAKVAPFAGRPAIVIYARDIRERLKMEREINEQRKVIDEKSQDIRDSIEYSKRIQRSILLEREKLKEYAPQSFIVFQPRDVVSGDFYWFHNYKVKNRVQSVSGHTYEPGSNILMVAAVDCTGHGVPGAFMSLIGNGLLDLTLNDPTVSSPSKALDLIDAELKKSLNKNAEDKPLRDGMDMALCCIDLKGKRLEYAGANNPLYIIRHKELIVLQADKQPITASTESEAHPFTNQFFQLESGDTIYLFSDGYADQFGGRDGKKFMYKRFKEMLISIQDKTMDEQKIEVYKSFQDWKGQLAQVDDVLVIGIRI